MNLCIDLCSGLGGASEAFIRNGWDVVRIDIERKFRPTIQADVTSLPLREGLKPSVLLCSPPCNHFSIASPRWPRKGIQKMLEIVGACFEAVVWLQPRLWALENPRGRLRKIVGRPTSTVRLSDYGAPTKKMTDIWGNVPFAWLSETYPWLPSPRGRWVFRDLARNPALRAKWPLGLSQAIMEAAEESERVS